MSNFKDSADWDSDDHAERGCWIVALAIAVAVLIVGVLVVMRLSSNG